MPSGYCEANVDLAHHLKMMRQLAGACVGDRQMSCARTHTASHQDQGRSWCLMADENCRYDDCDPVSSDVAEDPYALPICHGL